MKALITCMSYFYFSTSGRRSFSRTSLSSLERFCSTSMTPSHLNHVMLHPESPDDHLPDCDVPYEMNDESSQRDAISSLLSKLRLHQSPGNMYGSEEINNEVDTANCENFVRPIRLFGLLNYSVKRKHEIYDNDTTGMESNYTTGMESNDTTDMESKSRRRKLMV